ncbi:hypothetical protein FRACYDRAFT_253111 [Fragilariopsis cylindrus CCMP1102]|uniref:holo-[acyl-carrier-protein] synthase n=1 Tax=Fragilariopsis cylindrus CCMP1102 TaxID=635003 RepID=A0A1E7ELU2_9STRA|nr:hypothetical protein FRACYDRAFT_253111 [Fragilariopsis cylindrus CCMP1102]|eukprot:OEU06816.1 hypothetical protein FRACYDRAFT_253111 [Fragilariopsis cylindrus CCMP1102]
MGGRSSTRNVSKRSSNNSTANENERINEQEQEQERRALLVRRRLNDITCTADNDEQQQQQQQQSSCFRINLSLLDVSNEVRYDPDANHLRNLIQQHLQKNNAYSANTILSTTTDFNKEIATSTSISTTVDIVQKKILRFIQTQDKYTSFVSLLLKIIDLPRTKYKKPYIPLPNDYWSSSSSSSSRMYDNSDESTVKVICAANNNNNNEEEENESNSRIQEEDIFSFSISHQFPFVGMAQIAMHHHDSDHDHDHDDQKKLMTPLAPPPAATARIVGLDIVTFDDAIIKRLYSNSLDEFLNVFRDSFTKNEWNIGIQDPTLLSNNNNNNRLKEFYIRWSMKEAYTKAIGIGMGLEFKSFEICLQEDKEIIDDNDNDNGNNQNNTSMKSVWNRIVEGCACVCVGSPFQGKKYNTASSSVGDNNNTNDKEWRNCINVSWTELDKLLGHHH